LSQRVDVSVFGGEADRHLGTLGDGAVAGDHDVAEQASRRGDHALQLTPLAERSVPLGRFAELSVRSRSSSPAG
jgi:hypothetical protein